MFQASVWERRGEASEQSVLQEGQERVAMATQQGRPEEAASKTHVQSRGTQEALLSRLCWYPLFKPPSFCFPSPAPHTHTS
jgi:hypothetical protein